MRRQISRVLARLPLRTRRTYRLSAAVISAHVPPRLRRAPACDKLFLLVAALAVSDTGRSARLGDVAPAATVAGAGRGDLTDSPSSPSPALEREPCPLPDLAGLDRLAQSCPPLPSGGGRPPGCGPARWRGRGRARRHRSRGKSRAGLG